MKIPTELQPIIKRLTNWQRNQWARAGYPTDQKRLAQFAEKRKSASQ
jgi:hypothetical protein